MSRQWDSAIYLQGRVNKGQAPMCGTQAAFMHFGGQGVLIPEIAECSDVSGRDQYFREKHH
jgi:hypothetical protein